MKYLFLCLSAFLLLCGCEQETSFFVDVNNGSDSNAGTFDNPFKSIEAARDKVREVIESDRKQNVAVYIRGGKYYLDRPLIFNVRDKAVDGYRVTYTNFENEKVEIIGGKPVSGWMKYRDNIYKVELDREEGFHTLFENGQWSVPARTPNDGYFSAAGGANPSIEKTIVQFDPSELKEPFDPAGAMVHIWAGFDEHWEGGKNYDWYRSMLPVKELDWQRRQIICKYKSYWNVHEHNRYFIEGALEFLDSPGEWFFDSRSATLYYWPRSLPVGEQEIIVPSARQVILVQGTLDKPAGNLVFDGLEISICDGLDAYAMGYSPENGGAITLDYTKNVTITNCRLSNAGYDGIFMSKLNQGHEITNNLIEKCGFCGITGGGFITGKGPFKSPEEAYVCKDVFISNNYLRDCGKVIGHGSGMWLYECGDFEITHNLIENMPRYGINLLGGTTYNYMINSVERGGYGGEIYGRKVTWENHTDFICCRNNRFAFNEIRDVMKTSQDGGAIYSWGTGKGNVIENNYVHSIDLQLANSSAVGIYMDDASHYFTVRNNIIEDIKGEKYHFAICLKGVDIVCENNIVYDCDLAAGVYILQTDLTGFSETPGGISHERVDHLVLEHNIYYKNQLDAVYIIVPWKDSIIKSSDYNIVYPAEPAPVVNIQWENKNWQSWSSLLDGRYEKHSRFADPMFADAVNGNFSFKSDSPALEIGFEQVDVSNMGLKADFPFTAEINEFKAKPRGSK